MINEDELDMWILSKLSNGPLTNNYLVQGLLDVLDDVAEVAVREAVGRLRRDGKIRSSPDGTWKPRTHPVVVAEVPGDPNFMRGGR